jgi:trimeric autotransporter adhesin
MVQKIAIRGFIVLGILLLLCMPAVVGDLRTITQGNTVFLGESNINIAPAMNGDTQLGWWASGAAIATSSPDVKIPVSTPSSFYVLPSQFGAYTGSWYRLNAAGSADGVAFIVADPSLAIRVEDTTVNVDVTDRWVPRGDSVRFRIDSNLDAISTQRGVSAPVTLKVQSPNGGVYTALMNSAGTTTPIDNILITSSSQYYQTTPIWDTGNALYPVGTYTIWAECNVNSMNDEYGATGKTKSQKTSLLNQDQNPLISVNVPTTSTTTQVTPVSTTKKPTTTITTPTQTPKTMVTSAATTVPAVTTTAPAVLVTTGATTSPTFAPGFDVAVSLIAIAALLLFQVKRPR